MLKIVKMFKIRKLDKEIDRMLATMELLKNEFHAYDMMARDYAFWKNHEEARKARCEANKRMSELKHYDEEINRLIDERFELTI